MSNQIYTKYKKMSQERSVSIYNNKIKDEILRAKVKYGSVDLNSVLNKIIGAFPEAKNSIKEIVDEIKKELKNSEKMSIENAKKILNKKGVELTKAKEENKELKLEGDTSKVIMRIAPNPSGPLHFGHARMIVLNDFFTKKYKGKLICRIEDTDPERVYMPAYNLILEDLKEFCVEYDVLIYQSDRWEIYYNLCKQLISEGKAYVCTCLSEDFSKLKHKNKYCACRQRKIEENLKLFDNTKLKRGAVVRFKTPETNNPALREFSIMRFKKIEHPYKKNPYNWYPMMNFSVTIDDHLTGVTHILRGMDHLTNTEAQKLIYDSFGWEKPVFNLYGLLKLKGVELSKSKIIKDIKERKYSGFDDPQLWTLRALFRRGIFPYAIKNYLLSLEITKNNIVFDKMALYKENTKIIEPICTHLFFVENPVLIEVETYSGPEKIEILANPKNKNSRLRSLEIGSSVFIAKKDFDELKDGDVFRLKDGFNVRKNNNKFIFENMHLPYLKDEIKLKKIHWLPKSKENFHCQILMTNRTIKKGLVEPFASNLKVSDIVQFERVGYARIEKIEKDNIIAVFAY